jgi:hypothetical protein
MSRDWMIDVLTDLHRYARINGMARLSEQLEDSIHVAAMDMASESGGDDMSVAHEHTETGFSGTDRGIDLGR